MSNDMKYIYRFGAARTDGSAAMKNLLGGKGANLAEMCRLGITVPPGFTISTEACTQFTEHGKDHVSQADRGRSAAGRGLHRAGDGQAVRQCGRSAAAVGALRRPRVDARHDGHHPEPGAERRGGGWPGSAGRQRALCLGFLSPLRADVRRRRDGSEAGVEGRPRSLRSHHRHDQGQEGRQARYRARCNRSEGAGRALQGADPRPHRARLSHRPVAAALGRRGGRVRELEQRPRTRLSRVERHSTELGHCGQRAGHGVRQPRRHQRHRCGLHA